MTQGACTIVRCRAKQNQNVLQRVVLSAQKSIRVELPSLQAIYTKQFLRKAKKITQDESYPSHRWFSLLPSGKYFQCIRAQSKRMRNTRLSWHITLRSNRLALFIVSFMSYVLIVLFVYCASFIYYVFVCDHALLPDQC